MPWGSWIFFKGIHARCGVIIYVLTGEERKGTDLLVWGNVFFFVCDSFSLKVG